MVEVEEALSSVSERIFGGGVDVASDLEVWIHRFVQIYFLPKPHIVCRHGSI